MTPFQIPEDLDLVNSYPDSENLDMKTKKNPIFKMSNFGKFCPWVRGSETFVRG
jgi:hypothetical protein